MIDRRFAMLGLAGVGGLVLGGRAWAQAPGSRGAPQVLRLATLDAASDLPLWVAQQQRFFDYVALRVLVTRTDDPELVVAGLQAGRFDIGLVSADDLISRPRGPGRTRVHGASELFAFMGVDAGLFSFVARPGVNGFADLRGRTIAVDARDSGAEAMLRELLRRSEVSESSVRVVRTGRDTDRYRDLLAGRVEAALLAYPFDLMATSRGFRKLAASDSLGPYQGTVGLSRPAWARAHPDALRGFFDAWVAAQEWIRLPDNRPLVEAQLLARYPELTAPLAGAAVARLMDEPGGIQDRAAMDVSGVANVLALRARHGTSKPPLGRLTDYIDISLQVEASGPLCGLIIEVEPS